MARYTVCLKEHRDNIDYNRLKADAHKLQVADPSLSFDAAIAKATENVIAELKAQEAEILALLGEEPVAKPEKVEAAPKSKELWEKTSAEAGEHYLRTEVAPRLREDLAKAKKAPKPFGVKNKAEYIKDLEAQLNHAEIATGPEAAKSSSLVDHYAEVRKALSEGKPVPQEVLKDYPDLQPAPAKEAERTVEPEAKGEVQKAEEPEQTSLEHSGYHIYQMSIKGEPHFAVQSEDNKAKGVKQGFGDSLLPTLEAAKKEAELQARRAEETKRRETEAEQESAKEEAAKAERIDMDGFGDDLNPLAKGRLATALSKQVRLKGKADSVKNHVRALVSAGATTETFEEDRIKPMSRRAYNRADAQQQDEHNRRVREGGKKTVYLVEGFDLGKVAYDYANFLIARKADATLQKDILGKPFGMAPEKLVAMLPDYAKRMMKEGKLVVVKDVTEAQAYSGLKIPDTSQGFYYPKQDRVVLIADKASGKENLMMVLNHELLHRAEIVDPEVKATMKRLDDQFFERFKLAKLGKGTDAEREAYRRLAYSSSPKEFHMLEFRAYLVSEYNKDPNSLTGYIKKLVQDFIAAIRIGLMRAGVQLKELTAADMNRIAETYGVQAYRRGEGEVTLFSTAAPADLWNNLAAIDRPATWDQTKMKAGKVRIKSRETFFSALTQNQIVDLLTEIMPEAKQFAKERNNFDREESRWHNRADDIANRWADIVKKDGTFRSERNAQRNRLEQARIADMMHEMTVSEIDPRQPRPKDTGKNGIALHEYDKLKAKWDMLTPEAQTLINDVDKFHQDVTARLLETLTDKVQQSEMPEDSKTEIIKEIEAKFKQVKGPYFPLMRTGDYWIDHADGVEMFETEGTWKAAKKDLMDKGIKIYGSGKSIKNFNKVEGVDANFLESVNDLIDNVADEQQANMLKDGVFQLYLQALPENSMRKRMIHRKKTPGWEKDALRSFAKKAFHDGKQLAKLRYAPAMRKVLTDLDKIIKFSNSDKQYAMLNTRIETLKEAMDMLDHGVPFEDLSEKFGDDTETLRAVRRFSRFKNEADRDKAMGDYLAEQEALLEQVDAFKSLGDETKTENAADLLQALHKSYANMQESSTSWITTLINQSVFTWMLGFNPASALINMAQTPGVSLPVMAGRHQMGKSSRVLSKAYRDFFKGKDPSGEMGIYSNLKDDGERKMFNALTDNGLFDRTRSHDLAGLSDEGIARGSMWRTFMLGSTWAFHKAEVANREVTALAAYRLEFAKTGSVKQAIEYADKIVRDTHLDYSSANRPDLFQGNFARIMTQFKMYSQGMTYLWGKTFYDAFFSKAKSAEQKTEAKRVFYSLVGIQTATAGALGLPIGGILLAAEMIAAMFDDEDEPVDVEIEIRKALADLLGETGGRVVSRGLLSEVTGLDFHSRLSLADLWIREPDRELEGKDQAYFLLKTAFGPSGGLLEDFLTGLKMVEEGNTQRGLEKMMPKVLSSGVKALRMAEEGGATALSGEMLHEMNAWEKIAQGLGMRSAALAERQLQNAAFMNRQSAVGSTKLKLLHAAVNAKMKGDTEALKEAMDDIKVFNAKYPDLRITPASIMKSIKIRKTNKARTKEGLVVKPKYEFIREEEAFL